MLRDVHVGLEMTTMTRHPIVEESWNLSMELIEDIHISGG